MIPREKKLYIITIKRRGEETPLRRFIFNAHKIPARDRALKTLKWALWENLHATISPITEAEAEIARPTCTSPAHPEGF